MNRKFITLALGTMVTLGAQAGVKVTSVDLKTSGANGYVNIALDGRSNELPDVRVYGKTIEITLTQADAFSGFSKTVSGAVLSANVLNGKAIVKAVLPYNVDADGVNLGWKNKNIEVVFPRGKVEKAEPVAAKAEATRPAKTPAAPVAPAVEKKAENKVSKDQLNEDYLNKLMVESTAKAEAAKAETKKDEVNTKQAGIAREAVPAETPAPIARPADNFSFAGYAAKFTVFLAMVLGLFYGVVQLLKKGVFSRGKLGFLNNSQMIQVLSTTYVAPKRSLMVVKAHKQIFLVSNSENGIQFLSEMTDTTGLIKEGEKEVTGTNFDLNLGSIQTQEQGPVFKIKENINESTPVPEEKGIQALTAKDIVKFSDELKKKAKKLKPIEFN
ncbi:flagellar biosynthetic protein FliO [Peredibacter starrii]|uniref:Flagellar biosynthetic protein FliO n=1 Tax=Peredibacter starrii TaxID=28202 RepID=A0AAX4HN12_9BACT|nr:flagellar biosynthetic protein FliO [Peredibacter starrii]WPU64702.1 flagellar biosynthetic protein FliO [Peredibacter starrii]